MTQPTPAPPQPSNQNAPQRPDLRVVPDPSTIEIPAETAAEKTGPIPVLDAEGNPVTPRAPLDVQIRDTALHYVRGIPALGKPLPSLIESLEYSQTGDWATSEKSLKRVLHGLATLLAFLVTWPLVDVLGKARRTPGPFAIAVLVGLAILATIVSV